MKNKIILIALTALILGGFLTGCTSSINTGKLTFDVTAPGLDHKTEVPSFTSTTTVDPVEFVNDATEKILAMPLLAGIL